MQALCIKKKETSSKGLLLSILRLLSYDTLQNVLKMEKRINKYIDKNSVKN